MRISVIVILREVMDMFRSCITKVMDMVRYQVVVDRRRIGYLVLKGFDDGGILHPLTPC